MATHGRSGSAESERDWARRQRWTLWIGAPAGLPIGIHASFPVAFAAIAYVVGAAIAPVLFRDAAASTHLVVGTATSLVLYMSVLVHEVGHGIAARALGLTVDGIVLFALGGMIAVDDGPNSPRDELIVTAAGPLSSIAVAVASGAGYVIAAGSAPRPVAEVMLFLALTNGLLAVFNLLPSLPLDGGRLLHAALWRAMGSSASATRWASRSGVVFGLLVASVGIWRGIDGGPSEAFWYLVTGAFLVWGARWDYRQKVKPPTGSTSRFPEFRDATVSPNPGPSVEETERAA